MRTLSLAQVNIESSTCEHEALAQRVSWNWGEETSKHPFILGLDFQVSFKDKQTPPPPPHFQMETWKED